MRIGKAGWLACGGVLLSCGCNDVMTEEVSKDVCYSELRWVGGKRGSEEMYPGRDCVGCHIANDGPPLVLGGTIYPYIMDGPDVFAAQSGTDCFGLEGVTVRITDAQGLVLELTTNRAGNFFVEGNPNDFAKPFFNVELQMGDIKPTMPTKPLYGGCARCHDPSVPNFVEQGIDYTSTPESADFFNGTARIGIGGYRPNGPDGPTVEQELRELGGLTDD